MLFIRILNYLRGCLVITIGGGFPERFVNICVRRGIRLWDVSSEGGVFTCRIAARDFCLLRDIARITGARPRIAERRGLPFVLRRYRRRTVPTIVGIALFIFILYLTSTRVMNVDIVGNERVPEELLREQLKECGVRIGADAGKIEPDEVRNEMIMKNDELAWVGVNVRGSRVYIEIAERLDSESVPHITDEECSLVAAKDGVIARLEVKQGQTMVKKGDGVRAGDVLVSGVMDSVYGGYRLVHAYGDVFASTEYSASREYPLNYTEKVYTGNEKKLYAVKLFGREFDLYTAAMEPDSFDEERQEKMFTVPKIGAEFGGARKIFREYTLEEKRRTAREAVETGVAELTPEVEKKIPENAEIINKTNDHNILGDSVEVTVTYECLENIAVEKKIDKSLIDKNGNLDYDIESGEPTNTEAPE